jgi:hypothetical protein
MKVRKFSRSCFGPDAERAHHAKGCRPGRPLCRFMRTRCENRKPCGCDAYHFPHRKGSGQCGNPYAPLMSLKEYRSMKRAS